MKLITSVALAMATFLTACGGGGGGSTLFPFSGSVIDGKIKGAKVCLDVNSNALCDASEPTTTTDSEGKYSFTYTGGSIAGMHVLAIVGTDAFDSDSGQVTMPYNMLAPATSPSYVTPVTTLVSSEMINSKSTAAEAEKSVQASLDIKTDLLSKNVMDDPALHKIAQVTTVAMAASMAAVKDTTANPSAKGMSDADVLKQSVNLVRTQVLTQVVGAGGTVNSNVDTSGKQADILKSVEKNTNQTVAQTVSGSIENIVAASKSGDGTQVDMAALFKKGLMIVNNDSGDYIDAKGVRQDGNWKGYINALVAEFMQFDIATATSTPTSKQMVMVNNNWFKTYEDSEDYSFDGSSNWVRSGNGYDGKPSINGNCISFPITNNSDTSQTYCAVAKNLEGKLITDFVKDLCDADKKNPSAACDPKAVFPKDAVGYDLTGTVNKDVYKLWASTTWSGYTLNNNPITQITGSTGFIAYLKTNTICLNSCLVEGTLASGDKASLSGTIKWGQPVNGRPTTYTETTNFTVVTVGGKEILKAELPNLYRKLNPSDQHAYTIFGYIKGTKQSGMYRGDFTPANFKQSIPFTGNPNNGTQVVSPALFDAVMAQKGVTKYPY